MAAFSRADGQIQEEAGVEAFGPAELRRQRRHVVGGADDEDVGLVVVQPREQVPEEPGGDPGVAPAAAGGAGQRLLDLVDHQDAGGHGVGQRQGPADVGLRLADERAHQGADVEHQRRPAGLDAERPAEGALAGAGRRPSGARRGAGRPRPGRAAGPGRRTA